MITITECKSQTYLYSLIIITPNTKYDCGFRHIFRQKLVRSLFGQIVRRPTIRPHFSGAHFFWDPYVWGPFVRKPYVNRNKAFQLRSFYSSFLSQTTFSTKFAQLINHAQQIHTKTLWSSLKNFNNFTNKFCTF